MNKKDENKFAFLKSVGHDEERIVESLLKSSNIPVFKKYREGGGYLDIYMGMTVYGVDIYVPKDRLARAKEILQDYNNNSKAK